MNFAEIKARIQALAGNTSVADVRTLKTDVEEAWKLYILERLSNIFQDDTDESRCLLNCEVLFREAWPLIQGTSVSYTALPNSELTQFFVDIAKLISPNHPLEKLMPGLALESFSDDYPDLQKLPVEQVLKSYVLSDSKRYLYPVGLIAAVKLMDEKEALPYNPYYDFELGESDEQVNLAAWQRLTMHSPYTEAVIQAKAHYQKVSTEDEHLLSQLTTLVHQLELNDAHGGRGTQVDAAGQAYSPILNFRDYYQALPEEEVLKIPDKIKEEISLLFDVAFNADSAVRAENAIQTCIGSRREALYAAMKNHHALLAGVSLGEGTRQEIIETSIQAFNQAHDELKHAFETHTYTGKDNLCVTSALLRQLGITIHIESLADINFIVQGMEGQDLSEVLSQDNVRSQVIQQLTRLDDLVLLIMDTPNAKLPMVFHALEEHVHKLIRTPKDIAAFLISLQVDKIEMILQVMSGKLSDIINDSRQFAATLKLLSLEQCTAVILAMSDTLPDIIKERSDFVAVLKPLAPAKCTAVLLAMSGTLLDIIKSGADFRAVLKPLAREQRTSIYEAMKATLPDIFQNGIDFGDVFVYLTPEQRSSVYEVMKNKLPSIISNTKNFGRTLKRLSPQWCTEVTLAMRGKLSDIIKSSHDFGHVLKPLASDQCTAVLLAMSDTLLDIIKNGHDFGYVFKPLTPEQRTPVYEAMKDKLPEIIKNGFDFSAALEYLTPEQCTAVYEVMIDKLPEIIKNGGQFGVVLQRLTAEQCTAVVLALSDKISDIIKNGGQFGAVLQRLTSEQCTAVVLAIKAKLPDIINDGSNLVLLLKWLSPLQCTAVVLALSDKISDIIKNGGQFGAVLQRLTPDQCAAVVLALNDKLFNILENGAAFADALQSLSTKQRTSVFEVMKDELPDIILNIYELKSVSKYLNEQQLCRLLDIMKDKLLNMAHAESELGIKIREIMHSYQQVGFAALNPEEINVMRQLIINYDQQQNAAVKSSHSKARLSFFGDDRNSHKKPRLEKPAMDELVSTSSNAETSLFDDSKDPKKRPCGEESDDDAPKGKRPG
tara:strand:+ start:1446 stop:4607 length:3162 start_codon:yes stop_codon:yes gene_type:complete